MSFSTISIIMLLAIFQSVFPTIQKKIRPLVSLTTMTQRNAHKGISPAALAFFDYFKEVQNKLQQQRAEEQHEIVEKRKRLRQKRAFFRLLHRKWCHSDEKEALHWHARSLAVDEEIASLEEKIKKL